MLTLAGSGHTAVAATNIRYYSCLPIPYIIPCNSVYWVHRLLNLAGRRPRSPTLDS